MIFLMREDKFRYENLWADLRINMSQGDDRYPVDISSAKNMFYSYTKSSINNNVNFEKQIVLSQINQENDDKTENRTTSDISTPDCGKKGHVRPKCPLIDNIQAFSTPLTSLGESQVIPKTWVLFDSCSSINSICNKDLVYIIRTTTQPTRAWTNGGFLEYDKTYNLKVINMGAYYNRNGIANILSMGETSKNFRVTIDAVKGNFIKVS